MSFPCQCPPKVGEPFDYKPYQCTPHTIYINYLVAQLLLQAPYYNYIKTGVKQAPFFKDKYQYTIPIYTFKYYSIELNHILLKTYTYQQIFDFSLIALQYPSLALVPKEIKENWDDTDKEFFNSIIMLPFVESLYVSIATANEFRAKGKKYTYMVNVPKNLIPIYRKEYEEGQVLTKCYTGDELITIARNARIFVNAYLFRGQFLNFNPEGNY